MVEAQRRVHDVVAQPGVGDRAGGRASDDVGVGELRTETLDGVVVGVLSIVEDEDELRAR